MTMWLSGRRNLLFRCSIVINVAVLLYAFVYLTGSGPTPIVWVPMSVEGPDRTLKSLPDSRTQYDIITGSPNNETSSAAIRAFVPQSEDVATVSKDSQSSTLAAAVSVDADKKLPSSSDTNEALEWDLDQQDENALSDKTLARLRMLLGCADKNFYAETRQNGEYWILINYIRADHGPLLCYESITYTTHAGFEFLDNVLPLVERWMAPISVAMHAPGTDFAATVDSIRYLRDCSGSDLVRTYVSFHLFFSHKHIPKNIIDPESIQTQYNCSKIPAFIANTSNTYQKKNNLLYPINVARNAAREAALTHFVLPSDIELYPSPNLVPKFLNMIARNEKPLNTSTNPRVFPISIFEVDSSYTVPTTKTELQKMLASKKAIPFHKYVCSTCHSIPQAPQWIKLPETERMQIFYVGKRRGKYMHWEPVYIGTNKDPMYDTRLSWEGKQDKMTQGYVLCVKDYDFMILNNAFLIHKPGIKRYVPNKKRDTIASQQGKMIRQVVLPELKRLFGTRAGCTI